MARRCSRIVGLIALAGTLGWGAEAQAQVFLDETVPMETGLGNEQLSLEFQAAAQARSGNVSYALLNDRLLGRFEQGPHYAALLYSHAFAKQDGDRFMNAVRSLARYRYTARDWTNRFNPAVGAEGILHYDRDEFRRREHLFDAGGGVFGRLLDKTNVRWTLTAAYVFEFEKFAKTTSARNPAEEVRDSTFELNSHRLWLESQLGGELWETVHLGLSSIVQIPLDNCPCDTRTYNTLTLRVQANPYFALQGEGSVFYDANPGLGVDRFDFISGASLVFML